MAKIQTHIKFAIIVDGEVKGSIMFIPDKQMEVSGLASNPQIIEITNLENKPSVGWTWNGTAFNPPS
jgi:hypothetical protein